MKYLTFLTDRSTVTIPADFINSSLLFLFNLISKLLTDHHFGKLFLFFIKINIEKCSRLIGKIYSKRLIIFYS